MLVGRLVAQVGCLGSEVGGHFSLFMLKKTTVLNTLVTMTLTSDVENSKN